jgi:RimJ/RimL family protein N-acetyltransferase
MKLINIVRRQTLPRWFILIDSIAFIGGIILYFLSRYRMFTIINIITLLIVVFSGGIAIFIIYKVWRTVLNKKSTGSKEETVKILRKDFKEIITPRTRLNLLNLKDEETIFDYHNIPAVIRYQTWDKESHEEIRAYIEETNNLEFAQPGRYYYFAIRYKENDQLIGDWILHFPYDETRFYQVELGMTICQAYQGKGLAREVNAAVLDYCFYELKLHRVFALCDSRNTPSMISLERTGFLQEGRIRQDRFCKGEWIDIFIYGMLETDWREIKNLL